MTDKYAVFGNPIKHSKSPDIHTRFADSTDQDLSYTAICVDEDKFAKTATDFLQGTGKGLNITIPFKQEAWELAEVLSDRAELAGAVNTLYRNEHGQICGDNTDGIGMVRDIIENHQGSLKDKRILVLGAGGAVRGVLQPILCEHPSKLVIANRTKSKAQQLVELFSDQTSVEMESYGFDELQGMQFDLVINGTAASLQGEVPPLPDDILAESAWCYDMMYSSDTTAFCAWAEVHGAGYVMDGLGMLVEQAAESFSIWRDVRPATDQVIIALRSQLTAQ